MTVYFNSARQKWVYNFRHAGTRHSGYCVDECGALAKDAKEATRIEQALREKLAEAPVESDGGGFIYFVRAGEFIKIGWSLNPALRMASLQTACPHKIELIGAYAGRISEEQALHDQLREYHVRGEWFRADEILLRITKAKLRHCHAMHSLAAEGIVDPDDAQKSGMVVPEMYESLPDYWIYDGARG